MTKTISDNQLLGELGETAVKKIVLETGFIYEQRGRLEAGVDGLIELRDPKTGAALGKLLGVQVKATDGGKYIRETDTQFEYLLKPNDLAYLAPIQHSGHHRRVAAIGWVCVLEGSH